MEKHNESIIAYSGVTPDPTSSLQKGNEGKNKKTSIVLDDLHNIRKTIDATYSFRIYPHLYKAPQLYYHSNHCNDNKYI